MAKKPHSPKRYSDQLRLPPETPLGVDAPRRGSDSEFIALWQAQQSALHQRRQSDDAPRRSRPAGIGPPDRREDRRAHSTTETIPEDESRTQMPKNSRKSTVVDRKLLLALQQPDASMARSVSCSALSPMFDPVLSSPSVSRSRLSKSPHPFEQPFPIEGALAGADSDQSPVLQKKNKAEIDENYSRIKQRTFNFKKLGKNESLRSYTSTMSSASSISTVSSEMMMCSISTLMSAMPEGYGWVWSQRWCLSDVGSKPGQIKQIKDVCVMKADGKVALVDPKNSRIQLVSSRSGRHVSVLGLGSEDDITARSFLRYNRRRMEPAGICEVPDSSFLIATDLNRLLYIDTSSHGTLKAEVVIKDAQQLSGVAVTGEKKFIVTEIGMKPAVGLFDNDGKLIRKFKGDFKSPTYVAWNEEYEITAVADSEQSILLYDCSGRLLNSFGAHGKVKVDLDYPAGICWSSEHRLLVADRGQSRVVSFDLRNCSVEEVLTEDDGLRHPVALATNRSDRIVVTEEFYDFGVDEYQVKMFKLRESK